jgi:hypothetical protein
LALLLRRYRGGIQGGVLSEAQRGGLNLAQSYELIIKLQNSNK